MRTWFLAVAMAACVGTAHAECLTEPIIKERIFAFKADASITAMKGAQAADFLARFNAQPPVTNIKADYILFARHDRIPTVLVAFFTGGCMTAFDRIPHAELSKLLAGGAGSDI